MLLQYSLHAPARRDDIKVFMTDFARRFRPQLQGTADLIAKTSMSSAAGKAAARIQAPRSATSDRCSSRRDGTQMHFTGMTVLRLQNGKILEDRSDDGVTALMQLGLLKAAA